MIEPASSFQKTPDQIEAVRLMINQAVAHILLFGGSRSGKTLIILRQIILRALKSKGSCHCVLRRHQVDVKRAIWLGTLPKLLALCFPQGKVKTYEQAMRLILPNKSEVWFGGLDKDDKILGNEYATMFFNEISEIAYEQIEIAQSRLAQRCPEIINKFFYDCNPPSKSHWSYKLFAEKIHPFENTKLSNPDLYGFMRLNPEGNRDNLALGYIENTLQGMSERKKQRFLYGLWADDSENALWKREAMINPFRVKSAPEGLERIVVAIDPAVTKKETSDATGIIIVGMKKGHYYVLDDRTLIGSPIEWGNTAINAYHEFHADRVVAEVNQGGDLVQSNLRNIDRTISYRGVRATRGKIVRAEPIAALYEQGLVHHVGSFPLLEDEMCCFTGSDNEDSPDRLDALVWALSDLSGRACGNRAIPA
ncbi:MAG: phage terminase large subunit [Lentisphaerota bacterium]